MQETGASMHCVQAMQPNHAQNLLERDSNFAGLQKTTLLLLLLLLLQRPLFQDNLGKPVLPKTSLDLNEARDDWVLGWQWHQLDHMQTICTSFQTDSHTNTSSLIFYGQDALPDAQPTVSKH